MDGRGGQKKGGMAEDLRHKVQGKFDTKPYALRHKPYCLQSPSRPALICLPSLKFYLKFVDI